MDFQRFKNKRFFFQKEISDIFIHLDEKYQMLIHFHQSKFLDMNIGTHEVKAQ